MGNIVLLDDLTINKIAAGEVIERPASVVKEMAENSIDAGAKNINIEIKNGGISYIHISDDGKGILPDDMEIAFERHATSKIRSADDLSNIKSMGFRGEALASIAAISNVEMVSKTMDSNFGYRVVVEAGRVLEKGEMGCSQGTSITVRNLFFNTPVRYKFLKKDYTESGYIEDVVTRLALIHPEISFKLINSGKTIIQTNGDGIRKNCIYSIFGKDIANGIIDVNYYYDGITVDGVIGKPEIARNNRSQQLFFVNDRYVKDKTLSSAIEQGYKGLLTVGKHAFCILNVKMDPSNVDVNVHPAKLEVRFKEENKVFKAIYHTVKESLLKSDLIRHSENPQDKEQEIIPQNNQQETKENYIENNIETNIFSGPRDKNVESYTNSRFSNLFKRKADDIKEDSTKDNFIEDLYNKKRLNYEETANTNNITEKNEEVKLEKQDEFVKEKDNDNVAKVDFIQLNNQKTEEKPKVEEEKEEYDFEEMYHKTFLKDSPIKPKETEEKKENYVSEVPMEVVKDGDVQQASVFEDNKSFIPKYKFIGIAFSTYIILEMDKNLYIIDQHAAHERIMYERVRKNFYSDEAKDSQMMLLPDIITLTHKEREIVRENRKMFEKAGFVIEEFGDNTIKLTGVPNICIDLDTKELFIEILDAIDTVAITAIQEKEEKFIATVACKAAVKANMALDEQEVSYLMDDLLKLPNPFTCPHGRPTAIQMSKTDIEKKFSRR